MHKHKILQSYPQLRFDVPVDHCSFTHNITLHIPILLLHQFLVLEEPHKAQPMKFCTA